MGPRPQDGGRPCRVRGWRLWGSASSRFPGQPHPSAAAVSCPLLCPQAPPAGAGLGVPGWRRRGHLAGPANVGARAGPCCPPGAPPSPPSGGPTALAGGHGHRTRRRPSSSTRGTLNGPGLSAAPDPGPPWSPAQGWGPRGVTQGPAPSLPLRRGCPEQPCVRWPLPPSWAAPSPCTSGPPPRASGSPPLHSGPSPTSGQRQAGRGPHREEGDALSGFTPAWKDRPSPGPQLPLLTGVGGAQPRVSCQAPCSLVRSFICLFIHLFILLVQLGGGSFRQGLQQDPGCPLPAMRPAPGWAWAPESRSTSHHRLSLCVPLGPLTARPPVLTCRGGGCSCDIWAGPGEPHGPPTLEGVRSLSEPHSGLHGPPRRARDDSAIGRAALPLCRGGRRASPAPRATGTDK